MGSTERPYPVPDDEEARLWALQQYDILHSSPEEAYDDLVALAREIYDVPASFVGFLDDDRQWFKAEEGMGKTEAPREVTPCAWGIMTPDEPTVIEDLGEDPRFQDAPLVQKKGFRFYAGVPITTDDGHAVGTMCILDDEPQRLDPEETEALHALSRTASRLLELRRASHEMMRRTEELERFAGVAGERIKDPLSSVTVHLSFLEEDLADADAEIQENLQAAQEGTEVIEGIAEKLMEYARLDPVTAAEADALDLEELVQENWRTLQGVVDDAEATLEVGDLPTARADRRQVRHLLLAILDNAVRFHESDPIQVAVTGERIDGMCRITVADDGRGIEEDEDLDRLFEVFYRSNRSASTPGAGLGLTLAEKVVELHRGDIHVESTPGEGTTVSFTLPAADEAGAAGGG